MYENIFLIIITEKRITQICLEFLSLNCKILYLFIDFT